MGKSRSIYPLPKKYCVEHVNKIQSQASGTKQLTEGRCLSGQARVKATSGKGYQVLGTCFVPDTTLSCLFNSHSHPRREGLAYSLYRQRNWSLEKREWRHGYQEAESGGWRELGGLDVWEEASICSQDQERELGMSLPRRGSFTDTKFARAVSEVTQGSNSPKQVRSVLIKMWWDSLHSAPQEISPFVYLFHHKVNRTGLWNL